MTPDLWKSDLLNIKSIKALKESNAALSHYDEVLLTVADKINFCASPESMFWHASTLGANGIIGYLCWVALRVTRRFYEECLNGNNKDPWVMKVFRTFVAARGAINQADMPALLPWEHGYLSTFVELGGGKAGPPRKPYAPLPEKAQERLKDILTPLMEMEKELENTWV
jgi:dihydrodipicolinate synthase/N-acetylneuraminate lyase